MTLLHGQALFWIGYFVARLAENPKGPTIFTHADLHPRFFLISAADRRPDSLTLCFAEPFLTFVTINRTYNFLEYYVVLFRLE